MWFVEVEKVEPLVEGSLRYALKTETDNIW